MSRPWWALVLGFQQVMGLLTGMAASTAIIVAASGQPEEYLSWIFYCSLSLSGLGAILMASRFWRLGAGYPLNVSNGTAYIAVAVSAVGGRRAHPAGEPHRLWRGLSVPPRLAARPPAPHHHADGERLRPHVAGGLRHVDPARKAVGASGRRALGRRPPHGRHDLLPRHRDPPLRLPEMAAVDADHRDWSRLPGGRAFRPLRRAAPHRRRLDRTAARCAAGLRLQPGCRVLGAPARVHRRGPVDHRL